MCSGERPIGAAKSKQTSTMASCQTPRPPFESPPPPLLPFQCLRLTAKLFASAPSAGIEAYKFSARLRRGP